MGKNSANGRVFEQKRTIETTKKKRASI